MKHEHARNAANQAHAAAHGEIDQAGQEHEQHAERECRGHGELNRQQRKIARPEKVFRSERKENPNQHECDADREIAEREFGSDGWLLVAGYWLLVAGCLLILHHLWFYHLETKSSLSLSDESC